MLKATNELQDDGAGILHQVAQFPIGQVYFIYTRRPCPSPPMQDTPPPPNIQPVVVVRGLKRQQVAALTNFVGFFFSLSYFFFLFLGAEWPCRSQRWALGQKTYSIPRKTQRDKVLVAKQVDLYFPLNPHPLLKEAVKTCGWWIITKG